MKFSAQKILLIATRQIGDVLLVTPLLRSLRLAYPTAQIDVLVFRGKEGILNGNPDYQTLLTIAERPSWREHLALLARITRRYDLAVSTLAGDRPIFYSLLAAPCRVSIVPPLDKKSAWKRWITQGWTVLDDEQTHTVTQNLRLTDVLAIPRQYAVVAPTLPSDTATLSRCLPFAWQAEAYAVLHLLPMWRYKRWTLTGWAALAEYLTQRGLRVVLTGGGGKAELDYLQTALQTMPATVVNLAGQLQFSEVATLLRHACIYVGPDTAVTHLAAAVGVPTVALYGATNPVKWSPFPAEYQADVPPFAKKGSQRCGNVFLVQGAGECVPCHQEGCERHRESYSRCLDTLEPATVIQAVQTMLV
ncbi:glycosyltransferase family 9 protein [Beggiatoa leptomitoformis]|uniref:Lipopolysaccharide heptosyltransferase n=1 Tax=Beggiatoa leptomitoformis TaxID=288004 RepID=A0A2N9YGQ5_9GAMM|nr:glycosyltransferase family 9 protein [Beggiatoa leptomitoformis]ALG68056.1 lipopolysaccharide heptosyltransferase [Beggiatoa leptomitoformis]AUI69653.1 lipopolysaccharide heptosyltransferase [Beggiatoa leptomitoformis]